MEEKIMHVYKDRSNHYVFYEKTDAGEKYVFDTRDFFWDRIIRYQNEGYTLKFFNRY